ncbi:tetratricopeptide repeat-containing sulfotransferase family protein [Acidithiobacillus sp.]|uniref:tetratricopeptide repeat-containing sulfotransferase family protein n=1 Tax=Acidithiobacillus sp. TaxID=1872118 RepID=UPI003D04337B
MAQAVAWHQQGRADLALPVYRQALAQHPENGDLHDLLGSALHALGQPAQALSYFDTALRLNPHGKGYRLHRGLANQALGRLAEAEADYLAATADAPADDAPWINLCALYNAVNNMEAALHAGRTAIERNPQSDGAWNNYGHTLYKLGDFVAAEAALRRATAVNPASADAWHNLAEAIRAQGRGAESEPLYQRALALNPRLKAGWINLGNYYAQSGRSIEARHAYRQAIAIDPDYPEASINLAGLLVDCGEEDEAVALLRDLRTQGKATADHLAILAFAMRTQDRLDEAVSLLREIGEPSTHTAVEAWAQLALARKELLPEAIGHVREWLRRYGPTAPHNHRVAMHITLGQLLDRAGRYREAFAAAQTGKTLKGERSDPAAEQTLASVIERAFTAQRLRRSPFGLLEESRPVFIVGMPRSGTSLLEQMLSSHPAVHGAGEVEEMGRIVEELGGGDYALWPRRAALLDEHSLATLARRYLHIVTADAGSALRVTDKMPHNFVRLGLIALLFPRARVIHIRRDPRDTCLSIFLHHFVGHHPYANHLEDLAHHYLFYQRLMAHWRKVLPLPLLEVSYEDLTAAPEAEVHRILDFLELPWDPAVLQFYANRRAVLTSSRFQVREPIHRRAAGRWQQYARELAPLSAILAKAGC